MICSFFLFVGFAEVFGEIRRIFLTADVPIHYKELAEMAVQYSEHDEAFAHMAKMMCELRVRGNQAVEERERCEEQMADVMKNRSDVLDELIRGSTIIHAKTIHAESARDAAYKLIQRLGMYRKRGRHMWEKQ